MILAKEFSSNSEDRIPLALLRSIRARAEKLLEHMMEDLSPFKHTEDKYTFLRTPESPPTTGDVNVTTTCSCVMALVSTNKFRTFYKANPDGAAKEIMDRLLDAPWMSSGLILNNAFTTTLVLRTYGFLLQRKLFGETVPELTKAWDLALVVNQSSATALAGKLKAQQDPTSHFVYRSLTDNTRRLLEDITANETKLPRALTSDIRRIAQSGWIYDEQRFPETDLRDSQEVATNLTGYKIIKFNFELLRRQYPDQIPPPTLRSLPEIADQLASDPENFGINDYPPPD